MKQLVRFLLVLAAVTALAVVASRLRARTTAAPEAGLPGADPRPPSASAEAAPPVGPDDLARVRGIGPVYRARLTEAGISTFVDLAAADPAVVVGATGVLESRAADWIAQAAALAGR